MFERKNEKAQSTIEVIGGADQCRKKKKKTPPSPQKKEEKEKQKLCLSESQKERQTQLTKPCGGSVETALRTDTLERKNTLSH